MFKKGLFGSSRIMPGDQDWANNLPIDEVLKALQPRGDLNGGLVPPMAPGGGSGLIGSATRLAENAQAAPPSLPPMTGPSTSFQPALPDFSREEQRMQLPDMRDQSISPMSTALAAVAKPGLDAPRLPPQQSAIMDPRMAEIVGQAPKRNKGGARDILAALLAVTGDALSPKHSGPGAVDALAKSWGGRRDAYNQNLQNYELRKRMAGMPDMTPRELQAFALDPKAWAGSMSRDATSKFGASTLNPGDTRQFGKDSGVYQAPTRAQQYADSLGLEPGSDDYETAIRDQELNANGPTAFKNQQTMQGIRAASSMALQSQRDAQARARAAQAQRGRMEIRGAPAYRDLNPLPPRASGRSAATRKSGERTATDVNGNTVFYRGGRWVDAQGQPVQ